jgi:bacteriocin biosynthesis cyclodehydratase domain-containing protein
MILEHAQRVVELEGRATTSFLPVVLPLLDGTRTLADLVAEVGPPVETALVSALELLAANGLLGDGPPIDGSAGAAAVLTAQLVASRAAVPVAAARSALADATVAFVGGGGAAEALARLVRLGGSAVSRCDWNVDGRDVWSLVVVAPSSQEVSRLQDWNLDALAANRRWLVLLPFDGRFASVGPLFVPGESCCFECYRRRRRANVAYGDTYELVEEVPTQAPSPPAVEALVASAAALAIAQFIAAGDRTIVGRFQAVELRPVASVTLHHVLRVPRCPVCSPAAGVAPPLPWAKEEARARA